MSMRTKTLLLIGSAIVALLLGLFAVLQLTLGRDIARLNDELSKEALRRSLATIRGMEQELRGLVIDYSAWDDTYAFVDDLNDDYKKSNLIYDVFPAININMILIYNSQRELVYGLAADPLESQIIPMPQEMKECIPADSPLLHGTSLDDIKIGLLEISGRLMVIAACPILHSTNEGPARGTWVFGRDLAAPEIAQLCEISGTATELLPVTGAAVAESGFANGSGLDQPDIHIVHSKDGKALVSSQLVDLNGKPVALLQVRERSRLLESARRLQWLLAVVLLAVGSVFAAIVLLHPGLNLLNPLSRLSSAVGSISTGSELGQRISIEGRGELAALASDVNRMLERLEKAYQGLSESEQKYRRLVEVAQEGIISVDERETVTFVNPAVCRVLGYERSELVGMSLYQIVDPAHHESLPAGTQMRRQGITSTFENQLIARNGEKKDFLVTICPLYDADGSYEGAMGVMTDVTERKRNDLALAETQKLESLGVMAGGIAHDFNNILVGIMGNAELAADELPADSNAKSLVIDIVRFSRRAAELTQQMLAYSGRARFSRTQLCVNTQIQEMLPLIQAAIAKNAEIQLQLAPEELVVDGDATQIRQVVLNLAINAAEALGGSNGTVIVRTGTLQASAADLHSPYYPEQLPPGPYVYLEVADTGSGMDSATLRKLFDPFFTTKFTGRGLGLSAVLGIVRGHGGTIQVSSTPRRGSTFRVLLPALPVSALTTQSQANEESNAFTTAGTVLVVDDESAVRQVATSMLEEKASRYWKLKMASRQLSCSASMKRKSRWCCSI